MEVTAAIKVNAEPEQIFAVLSDVNQWPHWMLGYQDLLFPQGYDPANAQNTRFKLSQAHQPEPWRGKIAIHSPPKRYQLLVHQQNTSLQLTWSLQEDGRLTELRYQLKLLQGSRGLRRWLRYGGIIHRRVARHELRRLARLVRKQANEALKAVAENSSTEH